ncbi:hypothetical protein ACIBEJ_48555 [Nonomuraea sp. NPDC050790]|uniref:hypothetical protein n=1 Tax=Nonomuraea sp. NPDC050790 TaxID=3364371 RepID=UPI00378B0093
MEQILMILALIAAAFFVLSVSSARHPLTKCRRCHGRGVLRSVLLPWRYRPCPSCGRAGEIRARFGGPR